MVKFDLMKIEIEKTEIEIMRFEMFHVKQLSEWIVGFGNMIWGIWVNYVVVRYPNYKVK